jgi:hypothetical protein
MGACWCGCGRKLSGDQEKWASNDCKNRFNKAARHKGQELLHLSGSTLRDNHIHAARLESSPRLQRVLSALREHGKLTTLEIIQLAGVCAVNSIISELRRNNIGISCECLSRGVFQYTLREEKAA